MEKTQICLRVKNLRRCARLPRGPGRNIADLVRDGIFVLKPQAAGPVAIWDGTPKRTSIEHDGDSVDDEG